MRTLESLKRLKRLWKTLQIDIISLKDLDIDVLPAEEAADSPGVDSSSTGTWPGTRICPEENLAPEEDGGGEAVEAVGEDQMKASG